MLAKKKNIIRFLIIVVGFIFQVITDSIHINKKWTHLCQSVYLLVCSNKLMIPFLKYFHIHILSYFSLERTLANSSANVIVIFLHEILFFSVINNPMYEKVFSKDVAWCFFSRCLVPFLKYYHICLVHVFPKEYMRHPSLYWKITGLFLPFIDFYHFQLCA